MAFQIPLDEQPNLFTGWAKYALASSPFPDSGVNSRVLYTKHFPGGLQKINRWLGRFEPTSDVQRHFEGVAPLALFGSLGVGKSHLLHYLEGGIGANPRTPVLRVNLTEQGMERIVLSDLLTKSLPLIGDKDFVHAICESPAKKLKEATLDLPSSAPLRAPLLQLSKMSGDERATAIKTLSRWVRRMHTTPRRRSELGLSGPMSREGEALHVLANLCNIARQLGIIHAWYVFIDQLEELWRPGVITATRRARLLTDMRLLADFALGGSPIAMLMAWNTQIDVDLTVGQMLERDYRALWQRLPDQIDIPMLGTKDIWPFAERYLLMAGVTATAKDKRADLFRDLKAQTREIGKRLGRTRSRHPARQVLKKWQEVAQELVEQED